MSDNEFIDNEFSTNTVFGGKKISIDEILGGSLFENVLNKIHKGGKNTDMLLNKYQFMNEVDSSDSDSDDNNSSISRSDNSSDNNSDNESLVSENSSYINDEKSLIEFDNSSSVSESDDDTSSVGGNNLIVNDDTSSVGGNDLIVNDDTSSVGGNDLIVNDDTSSVGGNNNSNIINLLEDIDNKSLNKEFLNDNEDDNLSDNLNVDEEDNLSNNLNVDEEDNLSDNLNVDGNEFLNVLSDKEEYDGEEYDGEEYREETYVSHVHKRPGSEEVEGMDYFKIKTDKNSKPHIEVNFYKNGDRIKHITNGGNFSNIAKSIVDNFLSS
jgi:hypothetical protein